MVVCSSSDSLFWTQRNVQFSLSLTKKRLKAAYTVYRSKSVFLNADQKNNVNSAETDKTDKTVNQKTAMSRVYCRLILCGSKSQEDCSSVFLNKSSEFQQLNWKL